MAGRGGAAGGGAPSLGEALRACLPVFLGVRLALFAVALLGYSLLSSHPAVGVPGYPAPPVTPGWHNAVTGWERNDTLWFLRIAASGYRADDLSAAFFPLYPLAVRVVGTLLGGHWLLAGFVVSDLALLGGLLVLYRLTALELGRQPAARTVAYLCLFPTALFLFSPYSEPLFLLLAAATLLAARQGRWAWAGGLGAAAALTRSIGVVLALALLLEAVTQARAARRGDGPAGPTLLRGAAAAGAVGAGTAAYLAFWQLRFGDWQRPLSAQAGWGRHWSWPWETACQGARLGVELLGQPQGGYFTLDLLLLAAAFAAAVWVTRRCRPAYAGYTWASLLLPLLQMWEGRPFMSATRFLLPVFPLFWGFAAAGRRWRADVGLLALSAGGLAVLSLLAATGRPVF